MSTVCHSLQHSLLPRTEQLPCFFLSFSFFIWFEISDFKEALLTTHSLVPGLPGSLLMVDSPIPTHSSEGLAGALGFSLLPPDPYSSLEDLCPQTDLSQESPGGLVGPPDSHLFIRVSQVLGETISVCTVSVELWITPLFPVTCTGSPVLTLMAPVTAPATISWIGMDWPLFNSVGREVQAGARRRRRQV